MITRLAANSSKTQGEAPLGLTQTLNPPLLKDCVESLEHTDFVALQLAYKVGRRIVFQRKVFMVGSNIIMGVMLGPLRKLVSLRNRLRV